MVEPVSPLPEEVNEDSVEWITANANGFVEDQRQRAESLQTRAAQVAGFAGATVALGAPIGARALGELSGRLQTIAALCYFGAVAALAVTIVLSIVFVLRPVQHLALGAAEIRNYLNDSRFLIQSPSEIRFRTLKSLLRAAERYERVNRTKATFLKG
jgi:hypothetical protein